jgi:hypothetical protein
VEGKQEQGIKQQPKHQVQMTASKESFLLRHQTQAVAKAQKAINGQ